MADQERDGALDLADDPRVRPEDLRTVDGEDGRVVLVGVVHDHPASIYRARRVVERVAPDVLALELPSVAVPLFERYAAEEPTPPTLGGEMTAAIQGADTDRIVGIDMPSLPYVRELLAALVETTPSIAAVRGALRETCGVTRHALRCRAAAPSGRSAVDAPLEAVEYDCSHDDGPTDQADHEATHLARSRSLLGALEWPASLATVDRARNRAMARAIAARRTDGDVVAVVGFGHLDAVADHLADAL